MKKNNNQKNSEEAIFANIWMSTHSDTENLERERCKAGEQ